MDTTQNLAPVLSRIASRVLQQSAGFAGAAIAPYFSTAVPSGQYYFLGDGDLLEAPPAIKRSPGSGFARSSTRLSNDAYNCELYGHEEPVHDEVDKKYARPGASLAVAARRSELIIMLSHEQRVQALTQDPSVPTAAVVAPWTDAASDPIGDVLTARNAVFNASALDANLITMGRSVYEALKHHPAIRAAIKLSDSDARWPQLMAALFDVDRLVVAKAVVNNAQQGQAIQVSEVWGGSVIVAHVDMANDFEAPSFMRTFIVADPGDAQETDYTLPASTNTSEQIDEWAKSLLSGISDEEDPVSVSLYRQEGIRSMIVRAEQWTDEKITAPGCGFVLQHTLG